MPAPITTRRDSGVSYNKFKSTDMPEIRHVRSTLLKSLKLIKKTSRLDRITKAIVHDIDWQKLSVNVNSTDQDVQDRIDHLNSAIITFRSQLAEELEEIMHDISTNAEQQARNSASTPGIFDAASTMAHKYHARENKKPSARPRPHTHSTSSTPATLTTHSPRPADPSTKYTQGPRRPSTNTQHNNIQPSTTTSQRPRRNKPRTKARKTTPAAAQSTPTSTRTTRSTPSTSTTNTSRCTRSTTKKNKKPEPAPPTAEELHRIENLCTEEDFAWHASSRFASRSSDQDSDFDLV